MITFSDSRTAVRAEERQNHHEPLQKKPCPNCGAELNQTVKKGLPDGKYICPACHKTYIQKQNWFRNMAYLFVVLKLLDFISRDLAGALPFALNQEITSFIIEAALAIIIGLIHAKNIGILRKLGLIRLAEIDPQEKAENENSAS